MLFGGGASARLVREQGTPALVQGFVATSSPLYGAQLGASLPGSVLMRTADRPAYMSRSTPSGVVTWLNVAGVWKTATPWIRIGGTWKVATMNLNVGGIWKP